jgi:hypothetical protein
MVTKLVPTNSVRISKRERDGLERLATLIRERYPDAEFAVERGIDDPRAVHLLTTVDVEDTDEVVDYIIEPQMEMMIEEDLPLFVIPFQRRTRPTVIS